MHTRQPNPRAPAQVSPLPVAAAALAGGILIGATTPGRPPLGILDVATSIAALSLIGCCFLRAMRLLPAALLVCAVVAGMRLGAGAVEQERLTHNTSPTGDVLALLRIDGPVRFRSDGRRAAPAIVEAFAQTHPNAPTSELQRHTHLRIWLELDHTHPDIAYGDTLIGHFRMRKARPQRFPGDYDEALTLRLRHVQGVAKPRTKRPILHTQPDTHDLWTQLRRALDIHRQTASALLNTHGHESGLLPALALGEGGSVESTTRDAFSRCGLSHVLAVSGLHFGLVAWVIFGLCQALFRRIPVVARNLGAARAAALCAIPLMGLYVLFVGAPISATRAFVMAMCLLGGQALGREGHSVISLSLAALVLLCVEPMEIFSPGFQLSFAAVLGLLWNGKHFDRPFRAWFAECYPRAERILGSTCSALLATLGASLTTAPLVLYHFGQLPLLGMLANLWVVPVVSFLLLPLAFLATLLVSVWFDAAYTLVSWAASIEAGLVWSVQAFETLPGIVLDLPGLSMAVLALMGAISVFVLHIPTSRWMRRLSVLTGILLVGMLWNDASPSNHSAGRLRITFLPVGHGDATLIEAPNGRVTLIDAGGRSSGIRTVVPYVRSLGYTRIHRVIVTHPDLDHLGGMPAVIRQLRPNEVWTNGHAVDSAGYRDLLESIEAVGAQHLVVHACEPARVDLEHALRLSVLWPDQPDDERNTNANSIVIRLEHGAVSFLLMGDLEAESERALLQRGAPLGATVLKVGHHGSNTSSTAALLDAVSPHAAVISADQDGRFRLPHPNVTKRLVSRGIDVYRTDLDGAIRMESDGRRLVISTWSP